MDLPEIIVAIAGLKNDEVLFIKTKTHKGKWVLPGGNLEYGEKLDSAAKREFKEETGADIEDLEFVGVHEAIFPKDFERKAHFVILLFKGKVIGSPSCQTDEAVEVKFWNLKEALNSLQAEIHTKHMLKKLA